MAGQSDGTIGRKFYSNATDRNPLHKVKHGLFIYFPFFFAVGIFSNNKQIKFRVESAVLSLQFIRSFHGVGHRAEISEVMLLFT